MQRDFLVYFMENRYNGGMEQQDSVYFRRRALSEAGIAYSASAVLPVIASLILGIIASVAAGSAYAQTDWYRFLSYLLPQLCFAAAAVVYFRRSKVSLRATYRGCKWYYFPIAIALQFGLMFSLNELNAFFIRFLELFGYQDAGVPLPSLNGWNLLPAVIIIAVFPAVFEETIFRGILVRNMSASEWGTAATLLISGALFALFHGNPAQTLYQFVCGVCFALIAVRAGSILPSAVAHFLNNAVILALTATGFETGENAWSMPQAWNIGLCAASAVCLAAALAFLVFFDRKTNQKGGIKDGKVFFLAAAAGIAVCAVQWVVVLVSGFIGG